MLWVRINKVLSGSFKFLANLAEASTIAFQRATKFICCYHSAPCLVNPPCRAEVINPNRVVQRSMEIFFVSRFSGHLIGIAPVYELCHLFLANVFVGSDLLGQFKSA